MALIEMKEEYKRQEVLASILYLAEKHGKLDAYLALTKGTLVTPEIVKQLIVDLFVGQFCYYIEDDEAYAHYLAILWYMQRLNKNGFVSFAN